MAGVSPSLVRAFISAPNFTSSAIAQLEFTSAAKWRRVYPELFAVVTVMPDFPNSSSTVSNSFLLVTSLILCIYNIQYTKSCCMEYELTDIESSNRNF
jgi:hypothetical protein